MQVIDPMAGGGGFDSTNKEQLLTRYKTTGPGKTTAIPEWQLAASQNQYFVNSVANWRSSLIDTNNRLSGEMGIGLNGSEGLPLWMSCRQIPSDPTSVLGYVCAVVLAYVIPTSGPGIAQTLTTAGINTAVEGWTIDVDRYLLASSGTSSMTFDFDSTTGSMTTFDGPDNAISPTSQMTTFDNSLISVSKYYNFPLSRG